MSQMATFDGGARVESAAPPTDMDVEVLGPQEDLFLYKVEHLSLKKGERMVVPVTGLQLGTADAYVWQIPFSPPSELFDQLNEQEREQLMLMSRGARVYHKLRLKNDSEVPLTTAPVLILKDGQVLAQSLLRYTSIGGTVDVDVTVATDVHTRKWEEQTARQDNAKTIDGTVFSQLTMRGFLELTNYKKEAVTVEITRAVLGTVTETDNEGKITQLHSLEDWSFLPEGDLGRWPGWTWSWWSRWPWWWRWANDVSQIEWQVTLGPGETRRLQYEWSYYTR